LTFDQSFKLTTEISLIYSSYI